MELRRLRNFQEGTDTFVWDGSIIPINAMLMSAKTPAEKNRVIYPFHEPGAELLSTSHSAPAARATTPAPAVAKFVRPRYLPASSGGASLLARVQFAVRKRPTPAPRILPKRRSVPCVRPNQSKTDPMAVIIVAKISTRLMPQRWISHPLAAAKRIKERVTVPSKMPVSRGGSATWRTSRR